MEDKIKKYFDSYPKSEVCFSTSDGFLFHDHADAVSHGNALKNKRVAKHRRYDLPSEAPAKEEENKEKSERELMFEQYEELFGKKPAHNISNKNLKEAIEAAESQALEKAKSETLSAGSPDEAPAKSGEGPDSGDEDETEIDNDRSDDSQTDLDETGDGKPETGN